MKLKGKRIKFVGESLATEVGLLQKKVEQRLAASYFWDWMEEDFNWNETKNFQTRTNLKLCKNGVMLR